MRIGVILNKLDEDYQICVYKGIRERAKELGIDVFCIQQENRNFFNASVMNYFSREDVFNLDGIIYLTSVMTDMIEIKNKAELQVIFKDIPIVSVGQKIANVPSLITQTDFSMKQLVEHLILTHNYRNFVFFTGPHNHPDAIAREEIFKRTMEAYMPWYSNLKYQVWNGLFTEASAFDLMSELYKSKPEEKIDVVVCSNDNMAIGVYKFFKMNKHKYKINQCAVTGFDDISQSRYNVPAITTVHQPLEEIGKQSVDNVLSLIKGKELPEVSFVESRLVIRNSCGCIEKNQNLNKDIIIEEIQSEYVKAEQYLRTVSHFGQHSSTSMSHDVLRYFIKSSIGVLEVNDFSILLFEDSESWHKGVEDIKVRPFFIYKQGQSVNTVDNGKAIPFSEFLKLFLDKKEDGKNYVFKYLITGNECIGFALYNCADSANPYLCTFLVSVAQSIFRIIESEIKRKRSEYLEQEVEKRTHELIEANNRRMEVEAEVLKISEMERQRFSNDLHDDICQRLAGISMLCRSYSNLEGGVGKQQMIELAELITDTLQTTRQYAHNSFPVELNTLGLNNSINNLCNSFTKQSEIKCEYSWNIDEQTEFEATEKINIFRIIQEALHNTVKHARATETSVSVNKSDDKIIIRIADNGCGIKSEGLIGKGGMGLNSMQYRANQIGAAFEMLNNTPSGTVVQVVLPVNRKN